MAALPCTQHLGRPGIGAVAVEDDFASAEGGGAANDGTDVAGVLHAFQEHRWAVAAQLRQRDLGSNAGRGFGIGDGSKGAGRQNRRC